MALSISLVSDHPREAEGRAQLARLFARYDLQKWQFTDVVQLHTGVVPHSHPVLTLNTRHLDDDNRALATYLHEQLHWFTFTRDPGVRAALEELRQRFPSVPSASAGGARDEFSTYLHLIVCALEYAGLIELLGPDDARRTIESMDIYTWVYATLLADWRYFGDMLQRHGLTVGAPGGVASPD